jgi:hypothetical protein
MQAQLFVAKLNILNIRKLALLQADSLEFHLMIAAEPAFETALIQNEKANIEPTFQLNLLGLPTVKIHRVAFCVTTPYSLVAG